MGDALINSYKGSSMATAFSRGMSPERFAERAAAYSQHEQSMQDLRTLKATEPTAEDRAMMAEEATVKLQNALEQQNKMMRENNRLRTFDAYERYDADGDVRHINTMLTDLTKTKSSLFGDIARVDKLTENDRPMLEEMGLPVHLQDAILNNPELNKSYVKITAKDGTTSFGDLDVLKGVTGYNDYAMEKEITRQKMARELELIGMLGYNVTDELTLEAFRRTRAQLPDADPKSPEFQNKMSENYDQLVKDKKANRGSSSSINAITGSSGNPTELEESAANLARLAGFEPGDPGWTEEYERQKAILRKEAAKTSGIKNQEEAQAYRDRLEAEGFWEANIDSMTPIQRSKWEPKIRAIEELSGASLSIADRKTLQDVHKLTVLGGNASQLTDEQTGLLDSMLHKVKRYISNDVEGIDATAAYASFRNLVAHALYGSTLAANEAQRFETQFGSLGQQTGPVITQLKTAMNDIKSAFDAVAMANDPMVVAWRAGKTEEELLAVMQSIDDKIQYIDNISKGRNVPYTTVNPPIQPGQGVKMTPEQEAELDKILFGDS